MSLHSPGSTFSFGCDTCECLDDNLLCSCHALSTRREIREFSSTERMEYQNAVARLLRGGEKSIWTTLRNLYVTHIMHANSPMYFLFWNRIFVRTMERYLQEYSCSLTIPYFDFTLDSGSFSSSPIWRSDFFGSPTADPSNCQEYFITGSDAAWTPCIRRELKNNISTPTMVDIALALAESDFLEFTATVQGISEYLHHMIGGDMETTSSPHDPVFYSLHAYIDLLFWKWQKRHFSAEAKRYVTNILHSNLVPFNIQAQFLVDIEESLCYTYSSPPPLEENYNNVNDYGCGRHLIQIYFVLPMRRRILHITALKAVLEQSCMQVKKSNLYCITKKRVS
ncbi:Tyrosinase, partial [Stegodyphus mimosarum]